MSDETKGRPLAYWQAYKFSAEPSDPDEESRCRWVAQQFALIRRISQNIESDWAMRARVSVLQVARKRKESFRVGKALSDQQILEMLLELWKVEQSKAGK